MNACDVINFYGTQTQAAKELGVSQSAISNWKRRGQIPPNRQASIQIRTKGKLRADQRVTK